MSVTVAGADAPLPTEVTVATLADGTLGFVPVSAWPDDAASVRLAVDDRAIAGRARVVRSGPAYEETRARLRADAGRLDRWRLRRDRPVVLVTPTDQPPADRPPTGPPSRQP